MSNYDKFLLELRDTILREIYSARLIDESDPTYTAAKIINEAFEAAIENWDWSESGED